MVQELLEVRLLGPFEVVAGGSIADVGGSKRQALLAMLALRRGRVADVDSLVEHSGGRSSRRLRGTRYTITSPGYAPRLERGRSSDPPTDMR